MSRKGIRLSALKDYEYFQPVMKTTGVQPEEMFSFEVFVCIGDAVNFMKQQGYSRKDYTVKRYTGHDIEEPTFIDGWGNVLKREY